jgi:hypothetical protein
MTNNKKPQITIHFSAVFLQRMIRKARKSQMPLREYIWEIVLNIAALSPYLPPSAITLAHPPGHAAQGIKIRIHGVVVLGIREVAEFYNQKAVEFIREQLIYESMRP